VKFVRSGACLLVTSFLLLAGCSLSPKPPPSTTAGPPPTEIEHWSLRGRINVTHGEESWSGGLRWQHLADGDELTIRDPIGRTRLKASCQVNGNEEQRAQLQIAGQPLITGKDLESLLHSATRLYLPIQQLPSWITGRSHSGTSSQITTDPKTDRTTQITQAGWTISYPEYQIQDSIELPRKILLHDNSTKIRLVITRWQLLTLND